MTDQVPTLFETYELIAGSGLFDVTHYLSHPAAQGLSDSDALMHYIESGAAAGLSPRADFDVASYLRQCIERGEAPPANPLLHFITRGAKLGLSPARVMAPTDSEQTPPFRMWVEWPHLSEGAVSAPVTGSLAIEGWALAAAGMRTIEVQLDGKTVAHAQHGFRRDDVAKTVSGYANALHCGFAAVLPARLMSQGAHCVTLVLNDQRGQHATLSFTIEVKASEEGGIWSLRQKLGQAELDYKLDQIAAHGPSPRFTLLLRADPGELQAARRTLASLARQEYRHWKLQIVSRRGRSWSAQDRRQLLDGLPARLPEPTFVISSPQALFASDRRAPARSWLLFAAAGDEFGVDALLELALAAADSGAELLSYDERCANLQTGLIDAFLKPQWSPDLLRSTPYLGRAYAVSTSAVQRAKLNTAEWLADGDYHLAFRLTEVSRSFHHHPLLLSRRSPSKGDSGRQQRTALRAHLRRIGLPARVAPGILPQHWRLDPPSPIRAKVSIIIATRAARGLIRTCIESIRRYTSEHLIEIICIENIPADQQEWKDWLREHADIVVSTRRSFNWSRFNNEAAARASGDYLLFLNDDIEILQEGWLQPMLQLAARDDVGSVGPQLLYPDRTVQHAGVALTYQAGIGRHSFRHAQHDDPGYYGLALTTRNVIAVTGACLLTRREVFAELEGFDEAYTIVNNDIDYCLRCHDRGLRNVYTPYTQLIHHEMASRGDLGDRFDQSRFRQRWQALYDAGDPYLNPGLSRQHDDVTPEREPLRTIFPGHPLLAHERVQRIVVLKIDHLGDCVTALPALAALRGYFPRAHITMVSAAASRAIWQLSPAVDEIIEFAYFHKQSGLGPRKIASAELDALQVRLEAQAFDLAVDLRKSPDTRELLQRTGARCMAGFDHGQRFPWLDIALQWEEDPRKVAKRDHVGDDLLKLVHTVGAAMQARPPVAKAPGQLPAPLKQLLKRPLIALHPAAGAETRQWPLSYFARLVTLLREQSGCEVALIGSPDEGKLVQSLLSQLPSQDGVHNLAGKIPLNLLPAFLQRCRLFIGNNSGPHHLAAHLGVPTIGIHSGVVDAHEWGPQGPNAIALQRSMACSPCYLTEIADCPRAMACMSGIRAGDVLRNALEALRDWRNSL